MTANNLFNREPSPCNRTVRRAQELITGAINAAMSLIKQWREVDSIDSAIDDFDVFFNGLLPRVASQTR